MGVLDEKVVNRERQKSHNLALCFNIKFDPRSTTPATLHIRYSYGTGFHRYKSSTFKVLMGEWDYKKQTIKNPENHTELSNWIGRYKKKEENVRLQISQGFITYKDGLHILAGKTTSGLILESIKENGLRKKKTVLTIKKTIDRLNAVQTGMETLGYLEYSQLDYEHLQQGSHIEQISRIVQNDFNVKNNTKNDYLKALNYAYEWNPDTKGKPFNEFLKADEYIVKDPIKKKVFINGMTKINDQSQWFEAYLFWLLSFSLRGINGADICLLDESMIEDEDGKKITHLEHYLPDLHKLTDTKGVKHTKKVYIAGKRTKSKQRIKILFNQFPTLLLYRLLKRMVLHNRPHLAYRKTSKTNDCVKIYNIDYDSEKGKKDWKNLLNTYSKQMTKCCGYTISHARNTFQDVLRNQLGQKGDMLSVSLGHSTKQTYNKYSNVSQDELDILHIEVLKIFGINDVIKILYDICHEQNFSVVTHLEGSTGAEGSTFSKRGWFSVIQDEELKALNYPLTNWDWQKEKRLQVLQRQHDFSQSGKYNKESGKIEYDKTNYNKELKNLIEEKGNILKERFKYNNPLAEYSNINYNSKTGAFEFTKKGDQDKTKLVSLPKKNPDNVDNDNNVNKNVS